MNRRSFFKTSATTIGAIQVGLFASADATPEINTVLGPIPAGNLGRVLMHEHVLEDFAGADKICSGSIRCRRGLSHSPPSFEKCQGPWR